MSNEKHWTEQNDDAFAHRIAFDFIAQVEDRMEQIPMRQSELAKKLEVSEGAVSKTLNNPQNLTLRTIAKYSRALGMKASVIAYDDGDADNARGPIASSVFAKCWEWAGKPQNSWALEGGLVRSNNSVQVSINVNLYMNVAVFNMMPLGVSSNQSYVSSAYMTPSWSSTGNMVTVGESDKAGYITCQRP